MSQIVEKYTAGGPCIYYREYLGSGVGPISKKSDAVSEWFEAHDVFVGHAKHFALAAEIDIVRSEEQRSIVDFLTGCLLHVLTFKLAEMIVQTVTDPHAHSGIYALIETSNRLLRIDCAAEV